MRQNLQHLAFKPSSLILGFSLILISDAVKGEKHRGCLPADELLMQAKKFLRRTGRTTEHGVAHAGSRAAPAVSNAKCSDYKQWTSSSELMNRSLSPWRSILRTDHDLIPSAYEEAECLCSGCIINGTENTDYNSVPVKQSVMFLKKVQCPLDPEKYSLQVLYKTLPIACTCAVPKQ
ncbi:Interleukin-17C [Bagarius yarrelli]|uniref:Interleukin-17C n=1 Tax=Bagarius yarrelli TaxID=175774 RepID=A0A556TQZ9_BAGYA|nr:Interleukin-17C [Bagarius yarrelli]